MSETLAQKQAKTLPKQLLSLGMVVSYKTFAWQMVPGTRFHSHYSNKL